MLIVEVDTYNCNFIYHPLKVLLSVIQIQGYKFYKKITMYMIWYLYHLNDIKVHFSNIHQGIGNPITLYNP